MKKFEQRKEEVSQPDSVFFADDGPVYTMAELGKFLEQIKGLPKSLAFKMKGQEKYYLYNLPCSLDIETTSAKVGDREYGFMYIWMFGICGISIYGRTWEELLETINKTKEVLGVTWYKRLVCYVQNLGFEFQFMRKYFNWDEVFCNNERSPIYAVTRDGLEFRCSYILTGVRLEKVGEELLKYKCKKMVGDLDYSLVRTYKTPMSETELGYCINDIRVVMCKIQECIEAEGNIAHIPMTKTGYVRRDVKKAVFGDKKVKEMVQKLNLTTEEYKMARAAFQGGFTHANAYYSGRTQEDVVSYDFTSSYPSVMIAEKFPMTNGKKVEVESYEQFMELIRTKCCLFEIVMTDVQLKDGAGDAPISSSKCVCRGDKVVDNGRIREAKELFTTITEQDFLTYRKFYTFDFEIGTMYVYEKDYLPKPIVMAILKYYNGKTTLKDVLGKEEEYMLAKSCLNSIYGMMVMDIVRDEIVYDDSTDTWEPAHKANVEESIEQYNNSKSRFTWYLWGVWITAYARRNLFTGIYECGAEDYIYSDTDSIKIMNATTHDDYIAEYNRQVTDKLQACLDHYGLNPEAIEPLTVEGVKKPLGVWDFDGHYRRFKTLGAKRYMVEKDDGSIKTTIAGVGKKAGAEYFKSKEDPFKAFENGAKISADKTGKLTHKYIDERGEFDIIDYRGEEAHIVVESGIYLEGASFTLGLSSDYENLIKELQMGYSDDVAYYG